MGDLRSMLLLYVPDRRLVLVGFESLSRPTPNLLVVLGRKTPHGRPKNR